jgi:cytochrome c-type biogenesis protein CcmE
MKPKHQRLIFIVASMLLSTGAVLLALQSFKDNLVYFYTPSEVIANLPAPSEVVRIGGLVKNGTIFHENGRVHFIVTDGSRDLGVLYTGILPNLFREGQGVVVEGTMSKIPLQLNATTILAKHDENYMPAEVVDSLKKNGHWKDQYK